MLCKLNTIFQAIFVKFEYYRKISKKLSDPSISSKCYWTPLKILLNGRKIPCIPPLFHDSKYIADFKWKSKIFDSFFVKLFTLPSRFPLFTDKSLLDVGFLIGDIENIISKLGSNKAQGDDMISIRMLKWCDKSIYKLLNIIFKSCLTQGNFSSDWKRENVITIHKKVC